MPQTTKHIPNNNIRHFPTASSQHFIEYVQVLLGIVNDPAIIIDAILKSHQQNKLVRNINHFHRAEQIEVKVKTKEVSENIINL